MLSAKEAREQVEKGIDTKSKEQWATIEAHIDNAIRNGNFAISIDGSLTIGNRKKLEELGYKINTGSQYTGSQYNESYTSISW